MNVRRAHLDLFYLGRNLGFYIDPFTVSFAFTDFAHGQADELNLTLEDSQGLWRGDWFPPKGAKVEAQITVKDWQQGVDYDPLKCGIFEIVRINPHGPPDQVTISALSSLVTKPLHRELKTRAWQNTTLEQTAAAIAQEHGLTLFWEGEAVKFDRRDQKKTSDLAFLTRLCEETGHNVKVKNEKLFVYSAQKYDARPPALKISRGRDRVLGYNVDSDAHDVYRGCKVQYYHPDVKKLFTHTFIPESAPPSGAIHEVDRRVTSLAEAQRLAKRELRRLNKWEVAGYVSLVGDPRLAAGLTVELEGFGREDGVFFIEEVRHMDSSSEGYTTQLQVRKALPY
ncbi:MAG: hypothetical protein JRJ59_04650 [Deltaproteobacteria bacterium]|nr:hypothetical protein [Deltaproteobacteria bacterium]